MYKALMLMSLVFITLNNCISNPNIKPNKSVDCEVKTIYDTLYIEHNQFVFKREEESFLEIEIIDKELYQEIIGTNNPVVLFKFNGEYMSAKGNWIFSSSIPKDCDYFYPTYNNKIVINEDYEISFTKIK